MMDLVIHRKEKFREEYGAALAANEGMLAEAQKGERRYADSQGWLDTEKWAGEEEISRIEKLAAQIRAENDTFVLVGIGGSNNAARSVIEALQRPGTPRIVYAGNTLSPDALSRMIGSLKGRAVYVDCVAKNFETLEPGASFRLLRGYLYDRYGVRAAEHIAAVGTAGGALEAFCADNGYRFLEFPYDIGGRYAAVSSVGLLPMAVAGIDIRELVRGAHDMQVRLHAGAAEDNIAYQYACLRNLFYGRGYRVEMLAGFEPRLRWFYKWWIQLFAESEGKENKGIFPAAGEYSEDLHSVGQFVQDGSPILFETFLDVRERQDSLPAESDGRTDHFGYLDGRDFWEINKAAYRAAVAAHSEKLPCLTLRIGSIDAYHFGQMFYFFEFACYLSCKIMGVNAFDQPGVEAYKKRMFEALGRIEE